MSGYPYAAGEHYPETEKTRRYRARYNTRKIRSLESAALMRILETGKE